jgi:hypothetical protein
VAELSEWLKIMLGEVARKRDEQAQANVERDTRSSESHNTAAVPGAAGRTQGP